MIFSLLAGLPRQILVILVTGTGFVLTLVIFVLVFIMGAEGRYHLKRGFSGKGIDLLTYDRMTNSLSPRTIKYDGKYWTHGKDALYDSIDAIRNPSKAEEIFNNAIANTPNWKGNRRPVLFAVEELCWVFTPDFLELLERSAIKTTFNTDNILSRARDSNPEPQIEQKKDLVVDWLKKRFKDNIKTIHLLNPIDPKIILDHIDGATPYALRRAHDEGEDAGILKMTKPKKGIQLGTGAKIAVGAGAIFMIIILIVILQKGGLPIPGLGGK